MKFSSKIEKSVLQMLCLCLVLLVLPVSAASGRTVVAWGAGKTITGNIPDFGQSIVPAGLSGVRAIAAGAYHTVVLKNDGTVVAWGDNLSGETNVPAGLNGVMAIAAGGGNTVALKSDGTVVEWGYNLYGQTNVQAGLTGVTAIAAGYGHTVALKSDGTVVAWGNNGNGQTNVPVGLSGVTAVAAGGAYSVALKSDGTVVAWGRDYYGETTVPPGLSGVTAIAGGDLHAVALKSDGTVVAWGYNASGQTTGTPTLTPPYTATASPVILNGAVLSGITAIAAGNAHTVALKSDGTVVAWGFNGDGETDIPVGLSGVTAISAGNYHTVAIGVVLVLPSITAQPVGLSFALGDAVALNVSVIGEGLSYQWQFNGTPIPSATNSTLGLSNLSVAHAGAYRVKALNSAGGSITSQAANLLYFGDLKVLASTALAGPVGQRFRVDYADVLGSTTNWLTLTNVTLPYSPYVVIDPASPGRTNRFYRAVPLP